MKKLLVVPFFLFFLFVGASLAQGNKPRPLGNFWGGSGGGSGINVVEQQSNYPYDSSAVTNPTGCKWDINDYETEGTNGYLNAGASFAPQYCMVSDPSPIYRTLNGVSGWYTSPHGYFSFITSSVSNALAVSICYQPQGRCFYLSPIFNSTTKYYEWKFCGHAVYQQGDSAVTEIAGSNGGHGVITNITSTIINTASRQNKNVIVNLGVTSDATTEPGCTKPLVNPQVDYPFTWSAS